MKQFALTIIVISKQKY